MKRDITAEKSFKRRAASAREGKRAREVEVHPEEAPAGGGWLSAAAIRDIVESIAIAFMLAFLFRTFEAEAFVIPTGSMAPTLLGQHKEVTCPQCGHTFHVSASDEVDSETGAPTGRVVIAATCPLCRFPVDLRANPQEGRSFSSYKGDRIIVAKFPYQFGRPGRWDVAVFKYPGAAKTNFIKRVVGLPGETIMIRNGDLYAKPVSTEDFETVSPIDPELYTILRKPPEKVQAMLQLVDDNDRLQPAWTQRGWPARWAPAEASAEVQWVPSEDGRSFTFTGKDSLKGRLVYTNYVPSYDDWQRTLRGEASASPRPQLVSDFCGYNSGITQGARSWLWGGELSPWSVSFGQDLAGGASPYRPSPKQMGLHWVGDLAVEFELEVRQPSGSLAIELVEGGRRFRCTLDLSEGTARAGVDVLPHWRPEAKTPVRRKGRFRIMFANVDDQLILWVNGRVRPFSPAAEFPPLGNDRPTPADFQPVAIEAQGGQFVVRHLKVYRDVYYIGIRANPGIIGREMIYDFLTPFGEPLTTELIERTLSNCDAYAARKIQVVHFPLREGQYLVLGDNSSESMDSRLWEARNFEYFVRERLLIGKALFVFWPRALDRIPGTNIPIRFFPNFWRMRFVR
jgi:signal peptidase I